MGDSDGSTGTSRHMKSMHINTAHRIGSCLITSDQTYVTYSTARTCTALERIRHAIRVGTKESLEPVGGLPKARETVRGSEAR